MRKGRQHLLTVRRLHVLKEAVEQGGMKLPSDVHVKEAGPFLCNFLSSTYMRKAC
jgi:hypothetical protein